MARPAVDDEIDPTIILIPDDAERSVDNWLDSLRHGKPIELPVPSADLVASARHEVQ